MYRLLVRMYGILQRFMNFILRKKRKPRHIKHVTPKERRGLLDSIDTVISDCDGVLWVSKTPMTGMTKVIEKLRKAGKNIYLITNNDTKRREDICKKCRDFGVKVNKEEVVTTSWLCAQYLKAIGFDKSVYCIGSSSMMMELDQAGIDSFGYGKDLLTDKKCCKLEHVHEIDWASPNAGAVIACFDPYFSLAKLIRAANYLSDPKCLFLGPCHDTVALNSHNLCLPAGGVFVQAVESTARRKALIVGKPETLAFEKVFLKLGVVPYRTLMIGDTKEFHINNSQNDGARQLQNLGVPQILHSAHGLA